MIRRTTSTGIRYRHWQQAQNRTRCGFIGDVGGKKNVFFSRNFSYHESRKVFVPIITHKGEIVQDWLWQPSTTSVGENDEEMEYQDLRVLSRETDVCLSNLTSQKTFEQKMDQWNELLKNVSSQEQKEVCAQRLHDLLEHYSGVDIRFYQMALDAWNNCGNGDKTATILDLWEEKFGGNLNLAPTIDQVNVVLETYSTTSSISEVWEIGDILHSSSNYSIRPNIESYSHILHTLCHPKNNQESDTKNTNETKALFILDQLQKLVPINNIRNSSSSKSNCFLLRSYTDILSLHITNTYVRNENNSYAIQRQNMISNQIKQIEPLILQLTSSYYKDDNDDKLQKMKLKNILERSSLAAMMGYQVLTALDHDRSMDCFQAATNVQKLLYRLNDKCHPQSMEHDVKFSQPLNQQISKFLSLKPSFYHYHVALTTFSNLLQKVSTNETIDDDYDTLKELQIPQMCHTIVQQMEYDYNNSSLPRETVFDGSIYSTLLFIWLQCSRFHLFSTSTSTMTKQSESILEQMMHHHQHGYIQFSNPNHMTNAFNSIFLLLSENLSPPKALQIIEPLFQRLEMPDAVTYRVYLSLLSKLGDGEKALELINQMKQNIKTNKYKSYENAMSFGPNAIHYSFAIHAVAKSKTMLNKAEKAHQLLQELEDISSIHMHDEQNNDMMKANSIIYSEVIQCYAKLRKGGAQKADQLLRQLENRYIETLDKRFKPDIVTYTSVLTSYAHSNDPDSLNKAERLLKRIESKYHGGDEYARPNKICYTAFLVTLARKGRSPEAAKKAEETITKMERLFEESGDDSFRPDSQAYNTVIDVWVKSGSPLSVERAKFWLNRMEEKSNNGDIFVKPNIRTYTSVINAFRNNMKDHCNIVCEEAENILKLVEEKYSKGDLELAPDEFLYTCVINLWGRSRSRQKAKRAREILKRMEKQKVEPNTVTYTSVLNACEHTNGDVDSKAEALRIALETFSIMQKSQHIKPNNITFRTIISTVGRLVENQNHTQRNNIISKLFELCCEAGQVDEIVLKNIKKYTPGLYEKLPKSYLDSAELCDLPNNWVRQREHNKMK